MQTPSTNDRPLNVRLRADLMFAEVRAGGAPTWTVKDPLTLEHHHFTAQEQFLLEQLRRPASLAELRRSYERRFAPQRIKHETIWAFLNRCHEAGLLMSTSAGQADTLLERAGTERLRTWSLAWTQLLAIRLPGIDPDGWLTGLHRELRWLFSWPAAAAALVVMLIAASLVLGHFDEFRARLPELTALADVRNVVWMMVALAIVKVFHELGHALTCKHFGGEVHELGLMLLAFTPCLYCDVSDAWQMPSKKQRILISAAGIIVELVLASLAVIVWWYSQPGIINLLALNIVLISTVSTLIVNGNPLMRYDGYYIFSDLTETPNLWQRSRQVLGDFGKRTLLGLKTPRDAISPTRHDGWLAAYGLASKVYITLVVVGIVWMLVEVLHPLHLEHVAYGIGLVVVGGMITGPVVGTTRLVRNPLRRREVRTGRLAILVLVALVGVVAVWNVPVPYQVAAPLVLMPKDAERIYATVDGTLVEAAQVGQTVAAGDQIARLDNSEIRQELVQLEGDRKLQALRLENLLALRSADDTAAAEIPANRAALAAVDRQLEDRRRDAGRLRITAPIAGTVLPVPERFAPSAAPAARGWESGHSGRLDYWTGSLLDDENGGADVAAGTLVCWIGDPQLLEAVVLVDDAEAPRLAPGQRVRLELDALPAEVVRGEVTEIARRDSLAAQLEGTADAPLERLTQNLFPAGRDATRYQVRVAFDAPSTPLIPGSRGTAKISTEPMTLGRRAVRCLAQTFRLPM